MKETQRWMLIACYAPIVWGAAYYVTKTYLPADSPIWGAAFRALPAGIILLLASRKLPQGSWWWRSTVLGMLNMGYFFLAVYLAAVLLPSSTAATVMALGPMVMMLFGWILLRDKPKFLAIIGAALGFGGVALMVSGSQLSIDPLGLLVSASAMFSTSFGSVLTKKWTSQHGQPPLMASTSWQLIAGGLALVIVALFVEGTPPEVGIREFGGYVYLSLFATALAYLAWFGSLRRLSSGTVGLIGLLNPITGVVVGALLASEKITLIQALGIALVLTGVLFGQNLRQSGARKPPLAQPSRSL